MKERVVGFASMETAYMYKHVMEAEGHSAEVMDTYCPYGPISWQPIRVLVAGGVPPREERKEHDPRAWIYASLALVVSMVIVQFDFSNSVFETRNALMENLQTLLIYGICVVVTLPAILSLTRKQWFRQLVGFLCLVLHYGHIGLLALGAIGFLTTGQAEHDEDESESPSEDS